MSGGQHCMKGGPGVCMAFSEKGAPECDKDDCPGKRTARFFASIFSEQTPGRPAGSNADEWHLFLCERLDNRAAFPNGMTFCAVQYSTAPSPAFSEMVEALASHPSLLSVCSDGNSNVRAVATALASDLLSRQSTPPAVAGMVEALKAAKAKLAIYYQQTDYKYAGGQPYDQLIKQIDAALSRSQSAPVKEVGEK